MANETLNTSSRTAAAIALMLGTTIFVLPSQAAQTASPYTTVFRYNLSAQITGVISPSPDGTPLYRAVRNTYNSKGQMTLTEEGVLGAWQDDSVEPARWGANFTLSRKTEIKYDGSGRAVSESTVGTDNNSVGLTQYSYDDLNRVACKTVRMNPAVFGSLPSACILGPQGSAGPDRITRFDYLGITGKIRFEKHGVGTILEQVYAENRYGPGNLNQLTDQLDANGNLTHYEYDLRGRLKRMYFPQKNRAATATYDAADFEEYGYDENSNRTTLKKRDGKIMTVIYDNLNRVQRKDLPGADGGISSTYHSYDLGGRLKKARFGSLTGPGIDAVYNGFAELTREGSSVTGANLELTYQYDLNGNRTRVTHPDGVYFTYKYDQLDRLTDIYEGANTAANLIHYGYDAAVRPKSLTTLGNVSTSVGYDLASRPQSITLDPAGAVYDASYRLEFNPAGQVITHDLNNSNFQYLEKGSAIGAYQVNGQNQYTQVGNLIFGYDANGSLKSDGSTTYDYDAENRLIKVAGVKNAALKYDPLGRLSQLTGTGTTNFLYSGDSLVAEYENGVMTKRYVFGAGVDKPLVSYTGPTTTVSSRQFLHADHQGSAIAMTDSLGAVVSSNTYDAYGVPSMYNRGRFAYTGQTYLPEVGMYYYKARIYYPQIGRFLQTDPIGYKDQMNLYTYVGNDPLNHTDPDGKEACPGSSPNTCIRTDSFDPKKSNGQTTVASGDVAKAMVDNKGTVAVKGASETDEKMGFVVPGEKGLTVKLASGVKITNSTGKQTAEATKPANAVAVIHGHVDNDMTVASDGDAAPLLLGLTNGVVSKDRVGVTEIVGGRLQFRMLEGRMEPRERREQQTFLDGQQSKFNK